MKKREKIIEIIWFVVVLILFIISVKMIKSGELQSEVASYGIFAPLLIIILKMVTLIIAPLGGAPLYVIAGALLGTAKGFLICFLGDVLGSSVCFLLSRRYGQRILNFFAGSHNVEKVLKTVNIINNTKYFIKARIGFMIMPELLSYSAGLSRINFWIFMIINALFYVPLDFLLVFLGSSLAEFSVKYFFVIPAIAFIFTLAGFIMLYKDYEKMEGV